ncbi:MAG: M24 family metallopeptidase [Acidobacteria bacterium]|nr:MAG: M24 family metallopeptidase [Acidobacteriota bacterium]REK01735.1 MAG: M24 family metallopeptidase [Acidobacteriota bacterium]REK14691.1 MAG: M24 family metallopeptidase [Acidobacteriota bacterium]REK45406.1 MAG: M24 family metallopeptidase [Acidobacteriota bacterium]
MKKSFSLLMLIAVLFASAAVASDNPADPFASIRVTPKAPVFSTKERQDELARRRANVAKAMSDNSMLVMMSAEPKIYTNDVDYVFRQENNLYYLTAIGQAGTHLVIVKNGGSVDEYLFLPKRNPAFETWNGRMLSNEEARERSGIKNVIDASEWKDFVSALKENRDFSFDNVSLKGIPAPTNVYLLTSGDDREFGREKELSNELSGYEVEDASSIFAQLRLVKSPYELKILQHAIDITTEGVGRSMGIAASSDWEYEVQAELEYTFRKRNADYWGFPSIVGCGPNATTLHYVESQGKISDGKLLLMDVGAEYDHYTADITRTFPVNGKFSKEQAEIYQIVYDAQEAAAATMRPGSTVRQASGAAAQKIEEGLAKLGLITAKGATYDAEFNGSRFKRPQYTLFFMHGWGHWLGMNVHDVGAYGTFAEGMVITNEPGIYIREDALDYLPDTPENAELKRAIKAKFEKYKGIGVRIEDDMLVTKDGVEWMSKGLPRSIEDIERFMANARQQMAGRK